MKLLKNSLLMKGVEEINEIIKKLPSLAKGSLATGRSEQREHRPVRASVGLDAAQERIGRGKMIN